MVVAYFVLAVHTFNQGFVLPPVPIAVSLLIASLVPALTVTVPASLAMENTLRIVPHAHLPPTTFISCAGLSVREVSMPTPQQANASFAQQL